MPFQPIALHRSFFSGMQPIDPIPNKIEWVMIAIIEQAIDSEVNQSMRQRAN